nr:MAG TPA: hypothetical protein [Caudoviricetes sp.]
MDVLRCCGSVKFRVDIEAVSLYVMIGWSRLGC